MNEITKETANCKSNGAHVDNVTAMPCQAGDAGQTTAQTAATPPGGDFSREGGGAPASPSTGVAIYSGEALEKKSAASGGDETTGLARGAMFSVEEIVRRLWAADGAVTREEAMTAASLRLHDAARCFAMCGMKKAGKMLRDQADFAFKEARGAKLAREMAESDARLARNVARS